MNSKKRLIIVFLSAFIMPPIMWLFGLWFINLVDIKELIQIIKTPLMWGYVIIYISVIAYFLIIYLKKLIKVEDANLVNIFLKGSFIYLLSG